MKFIECSVFLLDNHSSGPPLPPGQTPVMPFPWSPPSMDMGTHGAKNLWNTDINPGYRPAPPMTMNPGAHQTRPNMVDIS